MRLKLVGQFYDNSGYAEMARFLALELNGLGAEVSIEPYHLATPPAILPSETEAALRSMEGRFYNAGVPTVYVCTAFGFPRSGEQLRIGYTMLEADSVTPQWAAACNAMDEVWVPSEFNRESFARGGVSPSRIQVVPLGVDTRRFLPDLVPLPIPNRRGCAFLAVFDWVPRKAPDVLVGAFREEFASEEDVCLILHTFKNGTAVGNMAREVAELAGGDPRILLVPDILPAEDMGRLYAAADVFVSASRGEGWNLPALEAMACGLPVVAIDWGGHREFLDETVGYPVPVERLQPVALWDAAAADYYGGTCWAQPDVAKMQRALRSAYTDAEERRSKGRAARQRAEIFTWEACARRVLERLRELVTDGKVEA